MLKGLRNEYLKSVGADKEAAICNKVREVYGELFQSTNQWNHLWKVIMRYFYPTMDNIYLEGQGGTPRVNEVYSSEQSVFLNDYIDFLLKSMFPEDIAWIRAGFVTENGLPIERSRLDVETLRYADNAVAMTRHWLKQAGFYEQLKNTLAHDTLLGNAVMQALVSWEEIAFLDVPISRLGVGRDSAGRVDSVCELFKYHDWEIVKMYGQAAMALFAKPQQGNYPKTMYPINYGVNTIGATSAFNSIGGNTDFITKTKDVIRLYAPNKGYSVLPHNEQFFPEMEYRCFVVTQMTGRLLDVELYPRLPFGVSRDVCVQGEAYGRGLGNLLLADVSVLNSKKKIEYNADAIQSQSPLVVKGQGFLKPPGDTLKPFQKLYMHRQSELMPLYSRAPLMQKAHTSYETEVEGVGKGLRKDRIDVALADRMTATEFTRRRDSSWALFAPLSGRLYKQVVKPCLDTLMSWFIITEKLPPMPTTLLDGRIKFNLEMFSVFSQGQESEVGENLLRAFGPLMEILPHRLDLLDNLNADDFLRSSLSRHELSKFVLSRDEVSDVREERFNREMAMTNKGLSGEQKGQQKFAAQQTMAQLQQGGGSDYMAVS